MIYQAYQAYEDSSRPLRMFSSAIVAALSNRPGSWANEIFSRIAATHELLALAGLSHKAPKFGVDPRAIRKTALLTIEGEKDEICGIGQTVAAQDLCSSLRPNRKTHHVQTGVGHYGVFNGKRWENEIYPIVRGVIHMSS